MSKRRRLPPVPQAHAVPVGAVARSADTGRSEGVASGAHAPSTPMAQQLNWVVEPAGPAPLQLQPWYLSSDPLAPYTVLRATHPAAYAALDATAKQRILRFSTDALEPPSTVTPRTRTEVPLAGLVRPRIPPLGALAPLRDRLWTALIPDEPDPKVAAAALQDEIVGRWAARNADLLSREVSIRLMPPGEAPRPPMRLDPATGRLDAGIEEVLEFSLDGHPLRTSDGSLGVLALDLMGSNDIETSIAEVQAEAETVIDAAALLRAATRLVERESRFWGDVAADPDAFALKEVDDHLDLVELRLQVDASGPPEGGIEGPLSWRIHGFLIRYPAYQAALAPAVGELGDLAATAWPIYRSFRERHEQQSVPDIELAEMKPNIDAAKGRAGREWDEGSYFVAVCDYLGWGLGKGIWGTANLITGDYYEARYQGLEAYRRGDIAKDAFDELDDAAAGRAVLSSTFFLALTLATAGLAAPVLGTAAGLGRTVAYSALSNAATTAATMTTTSVATRWREFEEPTVQAIWGQGAYSPGQIAAGAALAGAFGAAVPIAGTAVSKMFGWLRAVRSTPEVALALRPTGAGTPRLTPPRGWVGEEIAPGTFRLTHPDVPGEFIVTGTTMRYQTPTGTGGMRVELDIDLMAPVPGSKLLPASTPVDAEVDAAFARGLITEGPLVSSPLDAPLLDVGSGPAPADLGVGGESVVQIVRTDVVSRFPIDRVLDAEGLLPVDLVGSAQAVIINNPYGYVPNLAELAKAVKPGGKIIIQGHREANKYVRELLRKGPPEGFTVSPKEGFDPAVDLSAATRADPDRLAEAIRRNIMGGPFSYTKGGAGGPQPNVRVVYEKPIEGPLVLGRRIAKGARGAPSRYDHVVRELNGLQLGQRNAAAAAEAATNELGYHLVRVARGDDIVLSSIRPGPHQPILVVKPDGTVVRGWADIARREPLDLTEPFDLSNIVEDPPILPAR